MSEDRLLKAVIIDMDNSSLSINKQNKKKCRKALIKSFFGQLVMNHLTNKDEAEDMEFIINDYLDNFGGKYEY